MESEHGETVVQISPETVLTAERIQITVRCSDDPRPAVPHSALAEGQILSPINQAQELRLHGWIEITDPDLSDLIATVPDAPVGILALFGLLFAVVNSFFEEVLYRGVFMYALEAAFGSPAVALILQAVFFGLLHVQGFPRGVSGMVLAGVFGLALGYLRIRSRGIPSFCGPLRARR